MSSRLIKDWWLQNGTKSESPRRQEEMEHLWHTNAWRRCYQYWSNDVNTYTRIHVNRKHACTTQLISWSGDIVLHHLIKQSCHALNAIQSSSNFSRTVIHHTRGDHATCIIKWTEWIRWSTSLWSWTLNPTKWLVTSGQRLLQACENIMNSDKLMNWHIRLHNKIHYLMDIIVHIFVLWGYTILLKEYNGVTVRPRSYQANPIN